MDLTKVGYAIVLLLPGFFFVKSFNWSGRPRRFTDFELTLWIVALSVLILAITRRVLDIWSSQPSFTGLLADPTKAPNALRISIILAGLVGGWVTGKLDRWPTLQKLFRAFGVNLLQAVDLWQIELGSRRYITVWLKDGTVLYGWPERFSNNRKDVGDLTLVEVRKWSTTNDDWVPYPDPDTRMLIDIGGISYIEFHPGNNAGPPRFPRLARWWSRFYETWLRGP